jgi:SAM-dependent methyltransferase
MKIQYGCGLCAPEGWVNFDSSPTITLQRIPVFGILFRGERFPEFPKNIRKGNIAKGLPVSGSVADVVYCSHVLEHLSVEEFRRALANSHEILKKGGIFRFVLPDLNYYMNEYIHSSNVERSARFMEGTLLGVKKRSRGFAGFLRACFGGSRHLWMWDFDSMKRELEMIGFKDVRRASFGDSSLNCFEEVEHEGRWTDSCLGIECVK